MRTTRALIYAAKISKSIIVLITHVMALFHVCGLRQSAAIIHRKHYANSTGIEPTIYLALFSYQKVPVNHFVASMSHKYWIATRAAHYTALEAQRGEPDHASR